VHDDRVAPVSEEIADQLYAAPPEGFVAARAEAAARAKAAGDPTAAREILKLRRPTIAAWLVNLLAIRRPDLIVELAELAGALRAAQRELRGEDLRELSARRRAAVAGLVAQARQLAVEAEPGLDPARLPLAEVETTLNAALADAEVAALLAAGRLVRAVAYAGFGEVPRPQLRLVTGGGDDRSARERTAAVKRRGAGGTAEAGEPEEGPGEPAEPAVDLAALRRELAAARTGQKTVERDLERAAAAERDGARLLADLDAQLADLERRRSAAEEELSRRKLARKAAERAAVAARRRVGEAEAAVEATTDVVEAVGHDAPRTGRAASTKRPSAAAKRSAAAN
jgi:hypothetical protein